MYSSSFAVASAFAVQPSSLKVKEKVAVTFDTSSSVFTSDSRAGDAVLIVVTELSERSALGFTVFVGTGVAVWEGSEVFASDVGLGLEVELFAVTTGCALVDGEEEVLGEEVNEVVVVVTAVFVAVVLTAAVVVTAAVVAGVAVEVVFLIV